MFAFSGFLACLLSIFLVMDDFFLVTRFWNREKYSKYRKLMSSIDMTLHSLSDISVATGLALLITAEMHASCISAYHLNVICYLMIMSLITHTLTFVNVPEFCGKNIWAGAGRIIGIIATLILAWKLFYDRQSIANFPINPSPRLIMPAACFVGNQTLSVLSSIVDSMSAVSNGTTNVTTVLDGLISTANTGEGASQYHSLFLPVAALMLISFVFLGVDSYCGLTKKQQPLEPHWNHWQHRLVLGIRGFITVVLTFMAIFATVKYTSLRTGFEIEAWYVSSDEDKASLGQIVTILMSTSTVLAALKVIGEELGDLGPRGAKTVEVVTKVHGLDENFKKLDSSVEMVHDLEQNL